MCWLWIVCSVLSKSPDGNQPLVLTVGSGRVLWKEFSRLLYAKLSEALRKDFPIIATSDFHSALQSLDKYKYCKYKYKYVYFTTYTCTCTWNTLLATVLSSSTCTCTWKKYVYLICTFHQRRKQTCPTNILPTISHSQLIPNTIPQEPSRSA